MSEEMFTPAELRQLEHRAARLARRAGEQVKTERLLTFRRGGTAYGLSAADLRGARPLPPLTRLPRCPPHLVGVVNLGGHIVAALDLERFNLPDVSMPGSPWSLWLTRQNRSLAIIADELLDVLDVPLARLSSEVKGAFSGRLAPLTRAILDGPLVVLDGSSLLAPELHRPL